MTRGPATVVETYFVPRSGTVESVPAGGIDDLRLVRTELELLRRVRRRVAAIRRAKAAVSAPSLGEADRRELAQVLCDAQHPSVEETIALIDERNPELRKEILMSVVNEEAENIVQEAVESGVVDATDPQTAGAATGSPSPQEGPAAQQDQPRASGPEAVEKAAASVEDAIAAAEAELANQGGEADGGDAKQEDDATRTADAACKPAAQAEDSAGKGQTGEDKPDRDQAEQSDGGPDVAVSGDDATVSDATESAECELDDCLAAVAGDTLDFDSGESESPDGPAPPKRDRVEPESSQPAATPEGFVGEYTPERAAQAVEEIERGIRTLADLLSSEVSDQWKQARVAFIEVMEARTKAKKQQREAAEMAGEIARLKEEIEIARDDADVARREAKLMRDDTLRSKHRAAQLAEAAEGERADGVVGTPRKPS